MHSDVPTFLGFAAVGGKVTLDFPAQARAWTTKLAGDTGVEVEMTIVPAWQTKTRRQERGFHAMVAPYAAHRGDSIDDLKQWLLAEIFGTHTYQVPGTDAVITILAEPHTSKLTRRQYCDLIEGAMRLAAERDGVYLTAPDEYRKAKEAAAKQAARAARKQAKAVAAAKEAACQKCGELVPASSLVDVEEEREDGGQRWTVTVKACPGCAPEDMRRAG